MAIAVSNVDTFSDPHINQCVAKKIALQNDRPRVAIFSTSGRIFQAGDPLKKAQYGPVIQARLLDKVGDSLVPTNEMFAIKVYAKRQIAARISQENPIREISALQAIGDKHPNVMGQVECCEDNEYLYSVMQFCPGGELFDYCMDAPEMINETFARNLMKQLIAGLKYVHELGIAHRDMSLENILYDEAGTFKIIDFGMCLKLKKDPVTGLYHPIHRQPPCGKRNYIAPEVLRGDEPYEPMKVDIWALGIILFMVLTGVPPVEMATMADARYVAVSEGRLVELTRTWGITAQRVSDSALDLIQSILNPDPATRYTLQDISNHPWMQFVG